MYLHTELIRLLEQRGHVFPTDPVRITERLRHSSEALHEKLARRAEQIDGNRDLAQRLARHRQNLKLALAAAAVLWFVSGFAAAYALMRQSSLNFLPVLAAVLGINTLMLLLWLLSLALRRPTAVWLEPSRLLRGRDGETAAFAELYTQAAAHPQAAWHRGAVSHRLAAAGLAGIFAAALLLLTVRQYRFNWESTLLNAEVFARLTAVLGWLPEKIGFPVPDAAAVLANRNHADPLYAADWAGLLLGSIVCYGILPRVAAWAWCVRRARRPMLPDLNLPYYQNIINIWHRRITDSSSDYRADAPPTATVFRQPAQFWAVRVDAPDAPDNWFDGAEKQLWQDAGGIVSREDTAALLARLAAQNEAVRVLAAVRAAAVPDRGTLRRLEKLAAQAGGGLAVRLLEDGGDTARQWRQACEAHGWAVV